VNYWKLFTKLLDDNIAVDLVALLAYWYSHQQMENRCFPDMLENSHFS